MMLIPHRSSQGQIFHSYQSVLNFIKGFLLKPKSLNPKNYSSAMLKIQPPKGFDEHIQEVKEILCNQ